ncbi:MAG: N-acetyltransferase [Pseudobutyrivibrio ruminis]|uniref:GNAT family N-acetyltransferase n=1 Tax=Pseudobutyrivibrio ruminis TaxID=46206 RepID=UPI0026EFD79D|nr:N-acetyltransferase [Pseudobutyrivibrio ruminis]MBE5914355.1 N-acetyltransferase [Pseudobutyrivibrio ruminis]
MTDVYEKCPNIETDKVLLRPACKEDSVQLLKIYSDKNALPFFNSDNCHGDNFYYPTKERMDSAIDFWLDSYQKKWFVRWVIVEKISSNIIGSVELFHRCADDDFNGVGVLRIDLGSDYEKSSLIKNVLDAIVPPAYEMFECEEIISKVPIYAVERIEAFSDYGFRKSEKFLVGTIDHYAYKDYWTIHN